MLVSLTNLFFPPAYRRTAASVVILAAFFAVSALLDAHGKGQRVFASGATNSVVSSPEEVYRIWKDKRVRGRTLVLFGRYPHFMRSTDYASHQGTSINMIETAVLDNIVRKIYFIVPEDEWEEFRKRKDVKPIREVPGMARGVYLYNLLGVPVIATTPYSLEQFGENPLVYIDGQVFAPAEALLILAQKQIVSDIVVTSKGTSHEKK